MQAQTPLWWVVSIERSCTARWVVSTQKATGELWLENTDVRVLFSLTLDVYGIYVCGDDGSDKVDSAIHQQ